ncbi:hypothetical protein [Enteractinococcus helveticum]|uniref:DNA-binding protein n=1 Tax=Enteractinococcus helveticum TaxID=1837282 RepID=A0A1B7M0B4_9MICC|nr:hypothetical protein [Enteractinococcus helveticum]OAV61490.1 hypothetical protein A6F49_08575 [Enteractinococcus helveticum]
MLPAVPHEFEEFQELGSARRRLLDAGAEDLPRSPWQASSSIPPDDVSLLRFAMWRANSSVGEASHDEIRAALRLVESAKAELDGLESGLMLIARAEGLTWSDIAEQLGVKSPQAAQQRFQRVSIRAQHDEDRGTHSDD